ncbi:hypothetical protein ILUMI_16865, partial [Ignelater luminosus]
FIAYYSKVQSIIDCLEIEIEKPSNAIHQSLPLEYLISVTPKVMITYISTGFDGRASDALIVEHRSPYKEQLIQSLNKSTTDKSKSRKSRKRLNFHDASEKTCCKEAKAEKGIKSSRIIRPLKTSAELVLEDDDDTDFETDHLEPSEDKDAACLFCDGLFS